MAGTNVYPLTSEQNPVYFVPQNSAGFVLTINSGGYDMTGKTVTLTLTLNQNPPPASPVVVTLTPLTVQPGGMTASYTTVGGEFTTPGLYDALLRVAGGGVSLPSAVQRKLVYVDAD